MKRIDLEPASGIESSYKKEYKKEYWDVSVFDMNGARGNYITPDFLKALKKLDELVKAQKGTLRITDLYRSWETQAENRQKYLTGKKRAYVAKPGSSFHNAGRAVDIGLNHLQFEGVARDDWLDVLWDIAIPLGFRPIIKTPDMDALEAWHFDFPGLEWAKAYDTIKYPEVAKCCVLDVGGWNPDEDSDKVNRMFVQAQLIRLGRFDIGKVDGIFGRKTLNAIGELGYLEGSVSVLVKSIAQRPTPSL